MKKKKKLLEKHGSGHFSELNQMNTASSNFTADSVKGAERMLCACFCFYQDIT